MWNPLLSAMADVAAGPVLDDLISEVDMGRVALTCHFSLDLLWSEMHEPHVFLPQVLSLDELIPASEKWSDPFSWWPGSWSLGTWTLTAETGMLSHIDVDAAGKTRRPRLALPKRRKHKMLSYRLSHHRLYLLLCQM